MHGSVVPMRSSEERFRERQNVELANASTQEGRDAWVQEFKGMSTRIQLATLDSGDLDRLAGELRGKEGNRD